jgi:NIPSNAP
VLDLRTYRLVPGGRRTFDRILRQRALPMLRRYEIAVVGYGPSLIDDDHYYLARAFPSPSDREERLAAFYESDEWKRELEDTVTELIEAYHTVVIRLTPSIECALASRPAPRDRSS